MKDIIKTKLNRQSSKMPFANKMVLLKMNNVSSKAELRNCTYHFKSVIKTLQWYYFCIWMNIV